MCISFLDLTGTWELEGNKKVERSQFRVMGLSSDVGYE